jgi:hydrogenase-4 component B
MLLLIAIALISASMAGIFSLVFKRWPTISKFVGFLSLGVSGITAILAGSKALLAPFPVIYKITSYFPELSLQFKLDPLSGFFFFVVGLVVFSVAIYGPSYMRSYEKQRSITSMTFFTGLFIAGMYLVLLASDAFSFLFAWELMSLSSYFLVAYHHEHTANRSAAFLYLLMAHASGLFILLSYGVLIKFSDGMSFTAMQNAHLAPFWATTAFCFALIGFGMKAGIVPLHVWLPRAHPVAPSHISALMSGVMLKVAVYGFLRFTFNLLQQVYWQWGALVMFLGVTSAVLGILYALMQHDLKKLLAYSSVENIGIIFIGIGLSMIFFATSHPILGSLGLIAALYHCLNHALFKSLLFLGAGAILQHSHEQDLEKMGGLIHKMPYTALFFLIGCISISALPPFNGFVSEWLAFQTALQATTLQSAILRTLIPVAAALLALTGALAAACFVKVYGIAFLGQARTRHVRHARDPNYGMSIAMGFLSLLCLLFGIFPSFAINIINIVPQYLLGTGFTVANQNWLWLMPLPSNAVSYSALLVFLSIILLGFLTYWLLRLRYRKLAKCKGAMPWECGFGAINSRMQYTTTAFAMPIRRVFAGVFSIQEKIEPGNSKAQLNYALTIKDRIWQYIFEPLGSLVAVIARVFAKIQGGNVRVYLAYTFCTLIILLWLVS